MKYLLSSPKKGKESPLFFRNVSKLVFLFAFSTLQAFAQYPAGSPVAINGKLQVIGKYLRNECGNPVQLRGMSTHGVQWFGNCVNAASINALAQDWKMDVFRIAMYIQEGGYVNNPSYWKGWIDNVVDECGKKGVYVIIDFHVHLPGDPMAYITQAREFWQYMSTKHKDKKHVIYEICNEPSQVTWQRVKQYANEIIPLIRAIDPSTVIIVGSSRWSQDVDSVAYDRLNYSNLVYALHFYTQGEPLREKANIAVAKNVPLFVSEFGTSNAANTQGPFYEEMELWNAWLADNKISWANWSFCDKNEPSAALLPGSCSGNWNNTSASGTWVKNKMLNPADNFACNGDTQVVKNPSTPFSGTPISIPGTIEAENYDIGANGVAYRDFTTGNNGTANIYRNDWVDIINCPDLGGGFAVNTVQAGEWLNYTVNVQAAGEYDFYVRVATAFAKRRLRLEVAGKNIVDILELPFSSGTSSWQTVKISNVPLQAGIQDLRLHILNAGTSINYIRVSPSPSNPINNPPTVYISSPVNKASFTPPVSLVLQAEAEDTDGTIAKVEFFNGTTKLGEATSKPYAYTWNNVPSGNHSITAVATDNRGAAVTSHKIDIAVANLAPTIYITSPTNGSSFPLNTPITIRVNASDAGGFIKRVEFLNGNTKIGESTTSPFSFTWTNVPAGAYSIRARAFDNSERLTTSAARNITVADPVYGIPPTVTLTSPAQGSSYTSPATISLQADASDIDGQVVSVAFYAGTEKIGEAFTAPYVFQWTNVPAGTYELEARATDDKGAVGASSKISVTVASPLPPSVSIVSPTNGSNFNVPATIDIQATAADPDSPVLKVEFFNGTTKIGEDATAPYTFSWANVPAGTYQIRAVATDITGLSNASSIISVVVLACPLEAVPLASNWVLRNDWNDQSNGSRVLNTPDALQIIHRAWGRNRLYAVETGKARNVKSGTPYTLSFEVQNSPNAPVSELEVGIASGTNSSGTAWVTTPQILALSSSTTYIKRTVTITPTSSANVFLSFGLRWPGQPNAQVTFNVKNISFCEGGPATQNREEGFFGNEETEVANGITVKPNPSENIFFITSNGKAAGCIDVFISDLAGREMYHKTECNHEFLISAEEWPKGFYTLKVVAGNKIEVTRLQKN